MTGSDWEAESAVFPSSLSPAAPFMALYAYCLSDELSGEMLKDLAGVSGMRPRPLLCSGISVVVSDFEGERVAIERENVFGHERVVRRVLERVTPLPFRFGTLVEPDKLADYVKANHAALLKGLERVRDSVEMSVKIIWDTKDVGCGAKGPEVTAGEAERQAKGSGAAYLAARRLEILGDADRKERAEEVSAWLIERLGDAFIDKNVEVRPSEALFVRAAFLVSRSLLDEYRARLLQAKKERASLRFLTSGPWPPYSFSYINP